MKQSIIGEIYNSLTKEELKKLNKFMKVSHWSRSETIVKCHECLATFAQKDKLDNLDKEILFQNVYSSEPYSDNKLRFTLNRLLEAIREHILLEENEQKNVYTEKIWMDYIQEKKLRKNIASVIEDDFIPTTFNTKFLYNYFKSALNWDYTFHFNPKIDSRFKSLIGFTDHMELFADFVFLTQYCTIVTFSNVYNSPEIQVANERFNDIKNKKWVDNNPEFGIYISLIELLISNKTEDYYIYKEKVFEQIDSFGSEDKIILISYLINYTTAQINKGNVRFIDEQYELYNFFEKQGIFALKNFISSSKIHNIIHIYLRKKKFDQAESFINKYVYQLKDDQRESCLFFNLARIHFEKKEYKECLRKLLQVDFGKEAFYSINSKFLLLKTYFELKDSDPLISLCLSFKEYIKKNKVISESHKNSSLNFIRMVDKIYSSPKTKIKKLEDEILSNPQIAEKNWLLEKIKEKD